MRNIGNCTARPRRLAALLLALCLLAAGAAGAEDLASDLGGGFQAMVPEQQTQTVMADLDSADVVIGYIENLYASFSPLSANGWNMVSVNQLVYESVVDLDETLKPVPMLADNWTQEGKNWVFNLRSGIQFHNGYELTAYDVARSYQALASSGEENPYYNRLQMIETMEATDIYMLSVTAKTASMLTLYAMTFPVMQYETLYDDLPRGTGPYWYIQHDDEGNARLEANPLWWKQQPEVKSVVLRRYYNAGDAIEAIRTKQIDMLSTKSTKASLSRKLSGLTSMDYTTLTYEALIPNLSEERLTSDLEVRQAIMYAIDRSVIASNGYLDMAVQCEVPVPPNSWLYESQSAIYYYSPERALQLMHNAGWWDLTGDGRLNKRGGVMLSEPRISLITYNESTNSIRENAAKLIADYLEAVGFSVTVSVYGKARALQKIKDREYDLALVGMNLSEVPDLSQLFKSKGALNLNHFGSEEVDALFTRVASAGSEELLQKAYSDIQMTVVNRLPILGLLFRTGTVLSSRSIGGLTALRAFDTFNGFEFLRMG